MLGFFYARFCRWASTAPLGLLKGTGRKGLSVGKGVGISAVRIALTPFIDRTRHPKSRGERVGHHKVESQRRRRRSEDPEPAVDPAAVEHFDQHFGIVQIEKAKQTATAETDRFERQSASLPFLTTADRGFPIQSDLEPAISDVVIDAESEFVRFTRSGHLENTERAGGRHNR